MAVLVGLSLLIGAIVMVISMPQAPGYELSIYEAFPSVFWAFLVAAIGVGAFVIVGSALRKSDHTWRWGLLLMILANLLLVLLPVIRGYRMFGRSDAMTHLGFSHDIGILGTVDGNLYPPAHLLIRAVVDSTGMDPVTVGMLIPPLFTLLYFGAMGLLVFTVFDTRRVILLTLPFVALPVLRHGHLGLRPFDLSVMLLPIMLYLLAKGHQEAFAPIRAMSVIALIAVLLYHPLTAFFVTGLVLIYVTAKHLPLAQDRYSTPTSVFSLSAAVFVAWYSNYSGIIVRFQSAYHEFVGSDEETETRADAYAATVEQASPAVLDIVRVIAFRYGLEFVLFGLGFAFLGLMTLQYLQWGDRPDTVTFAFLGTLVLFSVGGVGFLLLDLIVPMERPFQIAKVVAIVLVGQLFASLYPGNIGIQSQTWQLRSFYTAIAGVLLVLILLSVFSLHLSPLGSEVNQQVTEMEIEGSEWAFNHSDQEYDVVEFDLSHRRFHHYHYGVEHEFTVQGERPPDHFNYQAGPTFGEFYEDDKHLVINELGRVVYPEGFPNYPENWRFTPDDYERLEVDPTVDRAYDNGDYNTYLVRATDAA